MEKEREKEKEITIEEVLEYLRERSMGIVVLVAPENADGSERRATLWPV